MSQLKIYHYPQCDTCRKAIKWFKAKEIDMEEIHIVDQPPTAEELAEMVQQSGLDIKKFFNTSGQVYKQENLKDKLPELSEEQKVKLLASNGKLIKRPLVTDGIQVTVGFNEKQFEEIWGK